LKTAKQKQSTTVYCFVRPIGHYKIPRGICHFFIIISHLRRLVVLLPPKWHIFERYSKLIKEDAILHTLKRNHQIGVIIIKPINPLTPTL
jgi:hypothetical protein